jgi:hypothetical protein
MTADLAAVDTLIGELRTKLAPVEVSPNVFEPSSSQRNLDKWND